MFDRTGSLGKQAAVGLFVRTGSLAIEVGVSLQKSAEGFLSYNLTVVSLSSEKIPIPLQHSLNKEFQHKHYDYSTKLILLQEEACC